jgi:ribonuclease E
MTKRMLIDATHAEETRVVVLDGQRLEDFDVETSTKRQLKGNIYLAKVVRVEPSLQAAFVEYGGNRHGFLAFSEIHPDYYQIPVADRQRLIEQEAEEARREEEEEDRAAEAAGEVNEAASEASEQPEAAQDSPSAEDNGEADERAGSEAPAEPAHEQVEPVEPVAEVSLAAWPLELVRDSLTAPDEAAEAAREESPPEAAFDPDPAEPVADALQYEPSAALVADLEEEAAAAADTLGDAIPELPPPETVGGTGDAGEETRERRIPPRFLRNYKIQEVIKRRQILLVQVVKEERGTKGAAVTTYLSLAGRYCVLMPNSPRGGGISRKITSPADRRRLKEIMAELDIPKGMGLIVRTAGANRPKAEIRRDCEYLMRLWDDIREHTLKSVAPALVYEEASLIKRAIRDVYSRDIDEIQVDGEQGWRAAHEFMRMLMPTHAKKVQLWKNGGMPLFAKYQVEQQLDSMLLPIVQLRSGGYLVINQTEALVAIDVNSGRSTRERGIEETALRTNLEAADEVARQLRLRDLAGLIVIDFIDMELNKHNNMVERRLKEALKNDRARIQVGHISHFGLMEMSRQRLRPSLAETSFIICAHCGGTGHVRSTESAAIHVLRGVEEEGAKRRAAEVVVYTAPAVALYMLNHKRERLSEVEERYGMRVLCLGDDSQMPSQYRIERVRAQIVAEAPVVVTQESSLAPEIEPEEEELAGTEAEDEVEATEEAGPAAESESQEDPERHRRRRRRRRSGRREEAHGTEEVAAPDEEAEAAELHVEGVPEQGEGEEASDTDGEDGRGRRRGRRGGRRRRHERGDVPPHAEPGAEQPELPPVYAGPTPANPFGDHAFDIFDVMEQVEDAAPPAPEPEASPVILVESEPVQAQAMGVEPEPELPAVTVAFAEPALAEAAHGEPEPEPTPAQAEEAQPEPEFSTPTAVAEPEVVESALGEPLPELAASAEETAPVAVEAASEPLVKPIIIGGDQDVVVEKKRGWWRR